MDTPRFDAADEQAQGSSDIIRKLQINYSFFAELTDEEVAELLNMCHKVSFEDGRVIFQEDDIADHFYLVLSGEVIISIGGTEVARMQEARTASSRHRCHHAN